MLGNEPKHRLSQLERLTLVGGEELERAVGRLVRQLTEFTFQDHFSTIDVARVRAAADFYSKEPWLSSPESFFPAPLQPPTVTETLVHGLSNGSIVDLSFPSHYTVVCPLFQAEYDRCAANHTVRARWWKHAEPPTATMIAVHGWTMGDQRVNSLAFLPGVFYQRGLDVILVELPYHGTRKGSETDVFPSPDPVRTTETVAQAVWELRQILRLVRSTVHAPVGAMGMSLGAYLVSLWAGLDAMDFCIPLVPLVAMDEVAWGAITRHPQFREWERAGLSFDLLQRALRVHSPLAHRLRCPKERAFIVTGIGDKLLPPRQAKLLWDHWKRPKILWLTGGHGAHIQRARAFDEILGFLTGLGYAGPIGDDQHPLSSLVPE